MASSSEELVKHEQTLEVEEKMYKTKIIQFFGRYTPIVLQNDNGPCPLIAICNVLLLRDKLDLKQDETEVSERRLFTLVAEQLMASCINNESAGPINEQLQRASNAIELLPTFASGINVDIKFNKINDFEFTRELEVFAILEIPIYHGWIIDPQDIDTANAIGSKSYNTLMEDLVVLNSKNMDALKLTETVDTGSRIKPDDDLFTFETEKVIHDVKLKGIESGKYKSEIELVPLVKKPDNPDDENSGSKIRFNDDWESFETDTKKDVGLPASNVVQESSKEMAVGITAIQGELINKFLKDNASQLTTYGLFHLNWDIKEYEICVFFRNNHFSTMYKFGNALYILVTDQGYICTPGVVWEKLQEINGDTLFANSNFKIFKPRVSEIEEVPEDENTNLASAFKFLADPNKTEEMERKSFRSDYKYIKAAEQSKLKQQSKSDKLEPFPSGLIVGPEKNFSTWPRSKSELSRKGSKSESSRKGSKSELSRKGSKRIRDIKEKCRLM